jgi:ABC-type multidrug transport system ATPase subunit
MTAAEAADRGCHYNIPAGHFAAMLGPSGCGKSTLLKVITGIAHGTEEGHISWDGRDLIQHDFSPSEIGYVPQFSIAHEDLTVRECVSYSIKLRVRGMGGEALEEAIARILEEVNMTEFADRLVRVLSGGQKRRLALAMELASKPAMLLCDEVTSGLDPQSEDEIVNLLRGLSRSEGRTVLSVTHSLNHLGFYDSVLVLFRGIVACGPPGCLPTTFIAGADLYSLTGRDAAEWADSGKTSPSFRRGNGRTSSVSLEELITRALQANRKPESKHRRSPSVRRHCPNLASLANSSL